ncbi:MAG: hypothetical protein ACT4N8_15395 [Sphingosinicella sp.]|uniref:hypothetical protein n=1 Tax=Sphingosinicella sp. TaxID=1917971 RepID=UPI004037CC91
MKILVSLVALALATQAAGERTIVEDPAALARLHGNSGITLQWIGWEHRGQVRVSERDGLVHLSGVQTARGGPGRLSLEGDVLEIGASSFTFHGRIAISDTPDAGRDCVRDGTYEFRVTQRRRYWRLQQMEQCDGLTDYVDIYF